MFSGTFTPSRWMAEESVALMSRLMVSPNSYCLGGAAGFDAGGQVARIMAAKAGFAQRAQQILQRLEAKKVETFVSDFKLHFTLGLTGLAASAGLTRWIRRLVHGDVIFLLHTFNEFIDQLIHGAVHLHLFQTFAHFLVEKITGLKRLLNGLTKRLERVFIHLLELIRRTGF